MSNNQSLNNRVLNKHWVRSRLDLKAGFYVRACVNCHGQTWIEFFAIHRKPWKVNKPSYSHSPWLVEVHTSYGKSKYTSSRHCGDLGLDRNRNEGTRLFRFSSKLMLEFERLQPNAFKGEDNNRTFVEALMTVPLTDKEWENEKTKWNYMKWYDEESRKEMFRQMQEDEFGKFNKEIWYA
jgi:hypothetical protein